MTNDRELLEHAAKAAGIEGGYVAQFVGNHAIGGIWILKENRGWNPLTDDGDALRLAVKLGLWVYCGKNISVDWNGKLFEEPIGDDPYAATRRAIVRAAAEIGRTI